MKNFNVYDARDLALGKPKHPEVDMILKAIKYKAKKHRLQLNYEGKLESYTIACLIGKGFLVDKTITGYEISWC